MRASEPAPARFLGSMAFAMALPLAAAAGLNLTMDPYGAALGRWYRLRPLIHDDVADRTPDTGTAARVNAAARSRAPVLLLGTSRTQEGFGGDPSHAFNAGQAAGAMADLLRVAEAAAQRPAPPRLYLIEAPTTLDVPSSRARAAAKGWPRLDDRLFAREASHVSLHLLGHTLGGGAQPRMREDFFMPMPLPHKPSRVERLAEAQIGRAFEPGPTPATTFLRAATAQLKRICLSTGARIVVVEPPVHPDVLGDPRAKAVVSARLSVLRRASGSGRCRLDVVDLSGFARQRRLPEALDPANWLDRLHFAPAVGAAVLRRVLAAKDSGGSALGLLKRRAGAALRPRRTAPCPPRARPRLHRARALPGRAGRDGRGRDRGGGPGERSHRPGRPGGLRARGPSGAGALGRLRGADGRTGWLGRSRRQCGNRSASLGGPLGSGPAARGKGAYALPAAEFLTWIRRSSAPGLSVRFRPIADTQPDH